MNLVVFCKPILAILLQRKHQTIDHHASRMIVVFCKPILAMWRAQIAWFQTPYLTTQKSIREYLHLGNFAQLLGGMESVVEGRIGRLGVWGGTQAHATAKAQMHPYRPCPPAQPCHRHPACPQRKHASPLKMLSICRVKTCKTSQMQVLTYDLLLR